MTIATIGRRMKKLAMDYFPAALAAGCGTGYVPLLCGSDFAAVGTLSAAAVGLTFEPGRAFCTPSTITRSPGLSPSRTMSRSPTVLARLDRAQRDHVVGADH